MRVREALAKVAGRLLEAGVANGAQEARWLLEAVLGVDGGGLACRLGDEAPSAALSRLEELTGRRARGEPLQYVLGTVEFHEIELEVGPGVLIPRPETEELVEVALGLVEGVASPRVCDVCTGSGAIALALAQAMPSACVWATDVSEEALSWARRNAVRLGLSRVRLLLGDLFAPLGEEGGFDLVTANPPYVSPEEYAELEPVVRDHEPRLALEASEGGLALLRRVVLEARERLRPGGWLITEMGDTQGDALRRMLAEAGYTDVAVRRDLAGHERMALGRWRP